MWGISWGHWCVSRLYLFTVALRGGNPPHSGLRPTGGDAFIAGRHRYHTAGGGCWGAIVFREVCYPVYTLFAILPAIALLSSRQQYVVMSSCRLAVTTPSVC